MKTNQIVRIFGATAAILLVPLVAMQFSDEVKWGLGDFIVIGALLVGAGFAYELIAAGVSKKHRILVAAGVLAIVFLVWVQISVGIIDSTPFAGN